MVSFKFLINIAQFWSISLYLRFNLWFLHWTFTIHHFKSINFDSSKTDFIQHKFSSGKICIFVWIYHTTSCQNQTVIKHELYWNLLIYFIVLVSEVSIAFDCLFRIFIFLLNSQNSCQNKFHIISFNTKNSIDFETWLGCEFVAELRKLNFQYCSFCIWGDAFQESQFRHTIT